MSMHLEDTEAFKKIIAADPECKQCFECSSPNPQWCDVNHGIFLCLECSGVHRSLGVHLSFVRSSTMDSWLSWRPEKLRQMQLGGNSRARLYFESHNIPRAPIKARYESEAALRYAAMLESEALGQPFNAAAWRPPEWYSRIKAQGPPPQQQQHQRVNDGTRVGYKGMGSPVSGAPPRHPSHFGAGADRFTGMGSSPAPHLSHSGDKRTNGGTGGDWLSTVTSGWSSLTQKASEMAHSAHENMSSAGVEGVKTSLSRGWTSVASTVSTYARQAGMEGGGAVGNCNGGDGLTALQQLAREEREKQSQQPTMPGRFDHIEHIAASASQGSNSSASNGWHRETANPASPLPTSNSEGIAWGVTTAVRPSSPLSAERTANTRQSGTTLTGTSVAPQRQVNRKRDDDWGWDDEE